MQNSLFQTTGRCIVTIRGNALELKTPYDPALVAAIKQIPAGERMFDPIKKTWLFDPKHAGKIEAWISAYFGETVIMPTFTAAKPKSELRLLEVHYIGMCKDRDGQSEAYGCDKDTNWLYIFPETILRGYFDGTDVNTLPTTEQTLYGVLGVPKGALANEILTAYRRMAMQWHPDHCREPNAHEMFLRIQAAYEVLSNPGKLARYNAGLALEASIHTQPKAVNYMQSAYRSPLRCGQIMAEGVEVMGRFKVTKILAWQDVYNRFGQTLISSWPMNAKEPVKVWA
jgi:hypothetical protein